VGVVRGCVLASVLSEIAHHVGVLQRPRASADASCPTHQTVRTISADEQVSLPMDLRRWTGTGGFCSRARGDVHTRAVGDIGDLPSGLQRAGRQALESMSQDGLGAVLRQREYKGTSRPSLFKAETPDPTAATVRGAGAHAGAFSKRGGFNPDLVEDRQRRWV